MAARTKEAARLTKENMREARALAEDVEKVSCIMLMSLPALYLASYTSLPFSCP